MVRRKPSRAVIYARISDDPEGRRAGVTRQLEDSNALLDRLGWGRAQHEPFIDNDRGASTRSRDPRPAYDEMLRLIREGGIDGIVFYSNSRLTRRPREFEDIIELVETTGLQLASVVSVQADLSTADGRQVARWQAAADAAEAERTGERVQRAFKQRRQQGLPNPSSRCYGFAQGGVEAVPEEAEVIREAVERITEQGWSLGMVVKDWNERGIPTVRNAKGWSRTSVKSALTKPRVAGLVAQKGRIIGPGSFEGIITPKQREQVLACLRARRDGSGTTFKERHHWLAGFMVCGRCGTKVKVNALHAKNGQLRKDSYVVCSRSQHGCGNVKRNLDHVQSFVEAVILNLIEDFEPLGEDENAIKNERLIAAERELTETREDIALLRKAFEDRSIRFKDYNVSLSALRQSEEELERTIGELTVRTETGDVDLMRTWETGSVEDRRKVVAALIDHIIIHPIGRVGPVKALASTPESVEIVFRA